MKNLIFQYPAWFLIFCLLLGVGYALLLYFRDRTFGEEARRLNLVLGTLRFFSIALIAFLLLAPLLRSTLRETRRPVVVLAQDVSESVAASMTEDQLSAYRKNLDDLTRRLSRDFDIVPYSFGSEVREGLEPSYTDKVTNISALMSNLYDLYSNQNLGAIILASDGIFNEGSNPVYASRLNTPIYTIALGDTTARRDLTIRRVFHNRIAYLGDRFTIQVDVAGINSAGAGTNLSVSKVEGSGTRAVFQEALRIDNNDYFTTREIILEADRPGVQRYRINVGAIPGEASTANNVKEIFIDVLDARQKILLLAHSPHPDLTALRQSISINKNYQVTLAYMDNLQVNPGDFDLVILHQLPSRNYDISGVLNQLNQRKVSRLFVVGTQTNLNRLNQVQPLIDILGDGRNTNEVQARLANGFTLFNVEKEISDQVVIYPPLVAPFGEYRPSGDAEVLLNQRIGRVETRYPLLLFGEENGIKVGVLTAEGIWKWRLFDFLQNENHDLFNALAGKVTQYLSLKEDKRRFRVNLGKNIFNENEPVLLDAELYNQSYELINEPDVRIVISNRQGKEFSYTFNKTNRAYSLNAGLLPVDDYTFRANVRVAGEELSFTGQFSVQPIQLELYETTADHGMLRLLSEKFGGRLVYPQELGQLPDWIEERGTIKPVIYETTSTRPLISYKWLFFVLLILLGAEWFLRRYFGAY